VPIRDGESSIVGFQPVFYPLSDGQVVAISQAMRSALSVQAGSLCNATSRLRQRLARSRIVVSETPAFASWQATQAKAGAFAYKDL
jgi:hypothetical protein